MQNFECGKIFKVAQIKPNAPILFAEATHLYEYFSSEDDHPEIPVYGFETYSTYVSMISQILENPVYSSIEMKREPVDGSQFAVYSENTRLMTIWNKAKSLILLTIIQPDEFEFKVTIQEISAKNFSINSIGFD